MGELFLKALAARLAEGVAQRGRGQQRLQRIGQRVGVARARQHTGAAGLDVLGRASRIDRHNRDAARHALQQHDPEGLAVGCVDKDVHALDVWPRVGHLTSHRDGVGEPQSIDELGKRTGVIGRDVIGVAADHHRVDAVSPLTQQRLGAEHSILALPRLHAPDETDDRHVRGKLERHLCRRAVG